MAVELPPLVHAQRPLNFPEQWVLPSKGDLTQANRSRRRGLVAMHETVLHEPAEAIPPEDIVYGRVKRVAQALVDVCRGERRDGRPVAGMAAPQIGIKAKIILADLEAKYKEIQFKGFSCLVNPEIVEVGASSEVRIEGCFSCYSANVRVENPTYAVVRGYSLTGKPFEGEFFGYDPRILRHEIDHPNGILAVQRAQEQGYQVDWFHPEHRQAALDYHRGQDFRTLAPWPIECPPDQLEAYTSGQLKMEDFQIDA